MTTTSAKELGAEVLELCCALPVLLLGFLVAAQVAIWCFSSMQFSSAVESTASEIDVDKVIQADARTQQATDLVSEEIASRMINASTSDIEVSELDVAEDGTANSSDGGHATSSTGLAYHTTQTTGRISFVARYRCPQLINIGEPLVLEHYWVRDRLLGRTAEVQ